MYTSLDALRRSEPRSELWRKLTERIGPVPVGRRENEPLPIRAVLESSGVADAIWALRAVEGHDREIRLLAVALARQAEHLMTDSRSHAALDLAERFARGRTSAQEVESVESEAWKVNGSAAELAAWTAGAVVRDRPSTAAWSVSDRALAALMDHSMSEAFASHPPSEPWLYRGAELIAAARETANAAQAGEIARVCDAIEKGIDPYPDHGIEPPQAQAELEESDQECGAAAEPGR